MTLIEIIKENLKNRVAFMSSIGWVVVTSGIFFLVYQDYRINYLFSHGLIPIESYERITSDINNKMVTFVTLVLLYFFKNGNTSKDGRL